MSTFKKAIILAIVAAFALGAKLVGLNDAAGMLCLAFILYLVFGEE